MNDEIEIILTKKQREALEILWDKTTIELLFGGGAGGGKSYLGCAFGIFMSLRFERIRGLMGRETLKGLKESTLLTFFDVCTTLGLIEGQDYEYNQQENTITFLQTGSVIYLKELGYFPGDPNYDRLGSTEYTWAFIDEAQQVQEKAKNIVRSRIRYKLRENGIIAKLLMTVNPSKGYLYTEFYRANKEGRLTPDKKFLQALATDNPFIDPAYIESLRGLDRTTRERLLFGNWEYDDDPSSLIEYDAILDLFSNIINVLRDAFGKVLPSEKYIIADVARFGGDRTVLSYWEGLACKRIAIYTKLPTVPDQHDPTKPSVAGKLNEWRELYGVSLSHVLVDEDGVGGGVVDYLKCKGFQGGRKPFPMPRDRNIPQNFLNLRAQCYFELAKVMNNRRMSVVLQNVELRAQLSEELEQVKAKDIDKDRKLQVIGKDEIKARIGRSPDLADNLMMRMWFEFAPKPSIFVVGGITPVAQQPTDGPRKLSPFEMGY